MTDFPLNTHLVTTDTVRALKGCSSDAVQCLVESGQLRWVWDVNARRTRQISELRYWLPELLGKIPHNATLPDVIRQILGQHRQAFRGVEVAQILLLSRPSIQRLRKSGALKGKIRGSTLWIKRPALEQFFNVRFIGNPPHQSN